MADDGQNDEIFSGGGLRLLRRKGKGLYKGNCERNS